MKEMCYDEAVLQSYFDGELSPDLMRSVATHLGACAGCAATAREIESETELMMNALAHEMELSVPTESLRARIDDAILAEQRSARASHVRKESGFRAWFASLIPSFNFSPQQAMGFASIIAVITFAAIFAAVKWQHRSTTNGISSNEIVATNNPPAPQAPETTGSPEDIQPADSSSSAASSAEDSHLGRNQRLVASGLPRKKRPPFDTGSERVRPDVPVTPPQNEALPGEQGYLKAIASLTKALNSVGDANLPPSVQAEYRRNLELVDQAIAATRVNARRNPQDA